MPVNWTCAFWHACHACRAIAHTALNKSFSVSNKSYRDILCFTYLICAYPWHCDTEIVPCHDTRARAFTLFPEIPWRVTYGTKKTEYSRALNARYTFQPLTEIVTVLLLLLFTVVSAPFQCPKKSDSQPKWSRRNRGSGEAQITELRGWCFVSGLLCFFFPRCCCLWVSVCFICF